MLTIRVTTQEQLRGIQERAAITAPVLSMFGAIVKSEAQAAFQRQSFGEIAWLPRYPKQTSFAFINIAGAVADFAAGQSAPDPRRFERRPAAVDTGTLQRSIAWSVEGSAVTIGSVVPYASAHNAGLTVTQPVTPAIQAALAGWLATITPKQRSFKRAPEKVRNQQGYASAMRRKLGFLFHVDTLETKVVRRPFLGLTDTMQKDFPRAVERWIAVGTLG